jgi:hypothetical protein
MIKIRESVKTEIESATGQKIPDPQSAQFEAFFEGLERTHSDLAKKLENALEVTEPFPEEEAQQNARRRQTIAQAIQHFFFKEIWGRDVLNRRALTFILFFLIFGTVATSWTVMLLRKPGQQAAAQTSSPVAPVQPVAEDSPSTPETSMAVPEPKEANLLVVPETEEPAQDKAPPPNLITPVPEAPKDIPVYKGEVPQESLNTPSLPSAESFGEQTAVTILEESQEGLESFPVLAFETAAVAAPVLAFEKQAKAQEPVLEIEAEMQTEQAPVLAPVLAESFLTPEASLEATALSPTNDSEIDSPVLAFQPVEEATPNNSEQLPATNDSPPNDLTIPETVTESNPTLLLETSTLEPETLPTDLLQIGTLIPATLTKDIVLTAGETRQVIADSDETWCGEDCSRLRWLGEATLLESGRLEVVFKQVVIENKVIDINGTAYGEDNAEGLPAHVADTTPTLLADLLRSGAGGVSDYVQAQTNKQTVTEQGDTTVTEQNVPALLDFILGRAASAVQIPEGETNIIRLAAVPKGTRLEVLYLGE